MSEEGLTREERDALVARIGELEARLWGDDAPDGPAFDRLQESYYAALGEYYDRLPRVVMSACPFCEAPYKHSFDPYGIDGFWWRKDLLCKVEEPAACPHFQFLVGALTLAGGDATGVREQVIPGPEVPFIMPKFARDFPETIAVVGRLPVLPEHVAWPIAYFSNSDEIEPWHLHQPWLRDAFWFELPSGEVGWSTATDVWDFELEPWLESGALRFVDLTGPEPVAIRASAEHPYPFADAQGERRPQVLVWGERELLDPPDGEPLNPFGEGDWDEA